MTMLPADLDRASLSGDYAASAGLHCLDCDPRELHRLSSPDTLADALTVWTAHRRDVHNAP